MYLPILKRQTSFDTVAFEQKGSYPCKRRKGLTSLDLDSFFVLSYVEPSVPQFINYGKGNEHLTSKVNLYLYFPEDGSCTLIVKRFDLKLLK